MLFNSSTVYSIKILLYLYENNFAAYVNSKDIAHSINLPNEYVSKILQNLARNGIVYSKKGKGGGFKKIDSRKDIKLIEIINVFEEKPYYPSCIIGLHDDTCECVCPMNNTWEKLKLEIGNAYLTDLNNNQEETS